MNICNTYQYSNLITISGLPDREDFAHIKANGFEIVVSLSMPADSKTIENEELLLSNLDITYMHIPVDYYAPTVRDFEIFQKFLNAYQTEKLWIHCTKNYRVSSFLYLYHFLKHHERREDILEMFWTPNETWRSLIDTIMQNNG
ncbi:MAG: protein tyrosine phosphatase family protein [Epsilonproteobacteria bacterium]|nr:protein tyrosine phosphatase family protein [Campylobacterota bacterium]